MRLETIIAVPPDGGWGWVIVAVGFYTFIVIDVPSIGFQVILQDLMDTLEVAASTANIIFSTYTLMLSFMGPVAGGICNRFGFKATTICGCFLMIVGLVVCFFLKNLVCFVIFFGLISGFGSSMVFIVASVAPGFWFEEKRAIAFGLSSSATGFAVFSVSLSVKIKDNFGWRWCFILWTAWVVLLGGLAFLLKMPPMVELQVSKSELDIETNRKATVHDARASIQSVIETPMHSLRVTNLPTERDVEQEVECKCKIPDAVVRAVNEMVDFTLFKSTAFLFLAAAILLASTAIYIPFLLIKEVNLGKMEKSKACMLTMVMGVGSSVGRGSIGFLLYFFPKIRALQVMIVFSMLGGFVICIVPLNHSVPYQMIVCFLGGAFPAVLNPLRSIIIIDLLGLKKLTNSTGILFFVQGIGFFIGMPIAALLNELSNTNYLGLVFSGVCYILTGITSVGIAVVAMLRRRTNDRQA